MKLFYSLFLIILFSFISLYSQVNNWKEYSCADLNIKFSVPEEWEIEITEDEVFGMSNQRMIGFQLFRPSDKIPIELWKNEVLKRFALSNFDFITENQNLKINNLNMLISEAEGYGIEFESQLYFYIVVINRSKLPFLAFTFCPVDDLSINEKIMKDVLLSLSEL